ncbi:FkbM family methyltransferase [Polynucleobacter sp. MWH-UH2A]|nr:FkbM family methyltransferase [Polynucleobacter sp. MWH-UH2A]
MRHMVGLGFRLNTVYDVGACTGNWSREIAKNFRGTELVLFEANPAYSKALIETGYKNFNVALSNPGRNKISFYNGTNTGDSYYKETTKFYDAQGAIELPCFTLDELISSHSIPIPNFIKLDTQGSELDILHGFSYLNQVDLVLIECPIVTYNLGAPGIDQYLDFFKKNRFIPVDILEVHRMENTLLQVDIIFAREDVKYQYFGANTAIRPFL